MRAFVVAALLATLPAIASAQGVPKIAVLGFAEDGSTFAFEQFGTLDSEQMRYSEIVVIDAATGEARAGSPFRTTLAKSGGDEKAARRMTYSAAQRMLTSLRITKAGSVVARLSGDPADVSASSAVFPLSTGSVTLKLESKPAKSPLCDGVGVTAASLSLSLVDAKGGIRSIHSEKAPPPERLCPTGYAIAEVRVFEREEGPPVLAALIAMDRPAFGSIDRRYIPIVIDLATPAKEPPAEAKAGSH